METFKFQIKKIIYSILFAGSIFFIIYLTYHTQKEYKNIIVLQSQQQLKMTAKSVANSIEEFFRMQKNVLKSLATDPVLLEVTPDTDYSQLEMRYKELEGEIGGFYIISPEGIVTHRFPHKKRVGKDFSDKPGVSVVLKNHKPYVSELFYSDSGRPCLTVLEPIFFNGKLVGILRALTYIEEIQKKFLKSLDNNKKGYAWVVDDSNRIIIHPKREYIGKDIIAVSKEKLLNHDWAELKNILKNMTNGEEGSGLYHSVWHTDETSKYGKKLAVYVPVRIGNQLWSIAVSTDYSEILKPINEQARTILGIAAFILFLFGIVGFNFYGKQKNEAVLKAEAENMRKIAESAEALKRSEEKLARSKKMESLGLLAGGVAHDLNNVLSGIVSYPDLLLMDIPQDSTLREPLLTIKQSGQKAATIVQDLLTLARRGVTTTEVLDINEIVSKYIKSPEINKILSYHPGIRIEKNLSSELSNIRGSSIHIKKTIMNLVSNAAEAQPGGGKIIVSTRNRYIDSPIEGYDRVQEGEYLILGVEDHGIGIGPNDIKQIFEPFYTKKVMGRSGTGLGMAVVWGTVKDHKGYINVQSTEGRGTLFELYLPLVRDEVTQQERVESFDNFKGNKESILVVDDIKTQREIAASMLDKLNYAVSTVSNGKEAIQFIKDKYPSLVVLDMIMDPGIDGLDTFRRIKEIRPAQKAIIVSGFAETGRVKKAQNLGAGKYIKKPYTINKIGKAIKEELSKQNMAS